MSESKPRPSRARIIARRLAALVLALVLVAVGVAVARSGPPRTRAGRGRHVGRATRSSRLAAAADRSTANLAPGSDPSVLPGPVLIADRDNNRLIEVSPTGHLLWEFPRPGDLAPGQTFKEPDDAFFSPDGREVIATQEDDFVISVIDLAGHRITYRYGHPGVPGSGPDYLDNPDDALIAPSGLIFLADIKNCRLLEIRPPAHTILRQFGETGTCLHQSGISYGSPNGWFPLRDGNRVVTEINGDWVDVVTPAGRVLSATNAPGFTYPSDTNEVRPGVLLSADYTNPGAIETFTPAGRLLWRYAPSGAKALDQPSLALPLPNGDVLANDDHNDRVIVIDPRTQRIVWQYGHTHIPGRRPGYLAKPDGVDLAPPYSLMDHFP
jgi:DNA-binding beta-propeller fold protein YncE